MRTSLSTETASLGQHSLSCEVPSSRETRPTDFALGRETRPGSDRKPRVRAPRRRDHGSSSTWGNHGSCFTWGDPKTLRVRQLLHLGRPQDRTALTALPPKTGLPPKTALHSPPAGAKERAPRETDPELKAVHSQVTQDVVKRLHNSWEAFKQRGHGFPRFKKYGRYQSFLFPQFTKHPIRGNQIKLPRIGWVDINLHREITTGFKVKGVRVVSRCRGTKWFVVITIQADVSVPDTPSYGRAIGVDVGLNDFLATSDGLRVPRPKFFVDLQSQLKLLQCRASRKQKKSRNWEKAQIKVSRLHHKIDNTRKDWQLKVAHSLCDQADSIFVEDLDYRVMAKGFLGKHSLDASFGQFRELLKWVCWKRGKFFATVDHRGTSKQCPNCGAQWDNNLSIRWHTCTECGYSNNRDVASAEVIRNRGMEKYPRTIGERKPPANGVLSGIFNLDKCYAGMPNCEVGKPAP